jgi:tetratricopeptide (TPR) repeat protein
MRLLFLAACFLFITPCMAQKARLDSLLQRLKAAKEDTDKVYVYLDLAHLSMFSTTDSSYYFAKAGEELSTRLNYLRGQIAAIALEGQWNTFEGDYPEGLRIGLTALRMADESGDPVAELDALNELGTVYYFQQEYRRSLAYFMRGIPLDVDARNAWKHERALTNTGDTYQVLGMNDSALFFSTEAYEIAKKTRYLDGLGDELNNLAAIYSTMGMDSLAHTYFTLGMESSRDAGEFDNFCTGALGNAQLFLKEGKPDSALFFAYLILVSARPHGLRVRELEADKFIGSFYESEGKTDSSYKYLKRTVVLQDTLYGQERLKAIQNMTFAENNRQEELAAQKKKEEGTKTKNLQLIAIAMFIPIFFLLVVFLYRIKVKPRIIEFLAIMNLLLVFEFVTDLTFPMISDWSNESPLWEMLVLVLLASILEPLNFKVESWLKRKLGTSGEPAH